VPVDDNRERDVCTTCGWVHYDNPRTVVACLVELEGGLLLCKRAIEPRVGTWTAPGGYLEYGESVQHGAVRETFEEALAEVRITAPYAVLDVPHIGQTYVLFRGVLARPGYGAGEESLEVRPFALAEIPWSELSFPTLVHALRWYVEEAAAGVRRVHVASFAWTGAGDRFDAAQYRVEDHLATPLA
jgi:ADP-ribose pyrophosphatase YjhB (NUDIX family)